MEKTLKQDLKLLTSTESSPRIALIGCGAIVEGYYLPALAKIPHVLKALTLVDMNIDRARIMAETFGVEKAIADYHEVLNTTDGAIIALPTHLHYPISMEFLSRGVSVLCEKPLAESADKAREMVNEAHKTGAVLAANYQQRLWPQFVKVKETIEGRSLGDPVHIGYQVGEKFGWPTVSGFYFNSIGSGRGVLRDRGAHVMDQICWWLGGKPKVTYSQNDSFGGSDAVAHVRFEHNKCVGEVKLSWLSSFPCRFVVEFERGSIEGEIYYPQSILMKTWSSPTKRVKLKSENYTALGHRMVYNFLRVLNNSERPLVQGCDVLNSISIVDECYQAASRFEMPWYVFPEK